MFSEKKKKTFVDFCLEFPPKHMYNKAVHIKKWNFLNIYLILTLFTEQ